MEKSLDEIIKDADLALDKIETKQEFIDLKKAMLALIEELKEKLVTLSDPEDILITQTRIRTLRDIFERTEPPKEGESINPYD